MKAEDGRGPGSGIGKRRNSHSDSPCFSEAMERRNHPFGTLDLGLELGKYPGKQAHVLLLLHDEK